MVGKANKQQNSGYLRHGSANLVTTWLSRGFHVYKIKEIWLEKKTNSRAQVTLDQESISQSLNAKICTSNVYGIFKFQFHKSLNAKMFKT